MFISKLVELEFQLDSKRFDLANFDRCLGFLFQRRAAILEARQ